MSDNLYIAAVEPATGKSLIALGLARLIFRHVDRLGFFRPVIRGGDAIDPDIELIRSKYSLRFPYERHYAVTYEEALDLVSAGRQDDLLRIIVDKYKELESQCEFVLCEGTDFSGISSAFEYSFDAEIAAQLGCPVVIVGSGRTALSESERTPEEMVDVMLAARRAFIQEHCTVAASILSRVDDDQLEAVNQRLRDEWPEHDPVYAIPERHELAAPTIKEIVEALDASLLTSDSGALMAEALDYKIAAMQLPNFLKRVEEGSLIIVPGDRADIILGCLASVYSGVYPTISGMVLTGGLEPAPEVSRLIHGYARAPMPILMVDSDTHDTTMRIDTVRAAITPDNHRKIETAEGLFESYVNLEELTNRISVARSAGVTPLMFQYDLVTKAKANRQHIVLPEGHDERVLRSVERLVRRDVADLTILGPEDEVRANAASLGLDLGPTAIVDPATSDLREGFAEQFVELRKHKGTPIEVARDTMLDINYFGTMMVYNDIAGGMVSGAATTTANTIRPAFQIIKTLQEYSICSSALFMCLADRVLVYADCAINPQPNARELADIAVSSADTAVMFGIEPRVAMLSYSTGRSGHGDEVNRVREATELARQARPELKIEGPIQYDAAVDAGVAKTKLPESEVAGRATVFIFPDLNTGNNTYKAVQRSAGTVAVGPVLQGLRKPVNDLSRGCTVDDIVNTVAITAVQAYMMKQARLTPA
ncbi:MAG: phosphate acetyltransferase [Planctomycetota bacterium]